MTICVFRMRHPYFKAVALIFTVKLAQVSMTWNLISSLPAQTDRYDKATCTRKYQKNTTEVSKSLRLASDGCCSNSYRLKWRWRRSWDQKDICPFLSQTCATPGETGGPWKKTKNTSFNKNCFNKPINLNYLQNRYCK